jgi:colanic acid biosynthesis glycosyl transferase WcaI
MNKKNQRILVLCQHFWPETFRITDIVEGLVENGYDVDVLCGIPNYPAGKFFDGYGYFKNRRQNYKGANIIRVPEIPRGNNTNFRILLNYVSFPFFALFYIPWLSTKKYDRILIYQLSPVFMALPGIILGKLKGIKTFIYILDFWPHSLLSILKFKNKYILSFLTNMSYWHYRQADGVIGVFKGIQTRLIDLVGLKKEKTLYIAQAAEKIYEKEVHDKNLEKRFAGKFNIVFAGNINPAQSFETVLEAATIVKKSGFSQAHYIIIGEGMSKSWLVSEVDRLGLKDSFSFEGFMPVEEVPKYQTLADAMIVALSKSPLFEYGVPAKVQSYLAGGKPIVGAMDGEGKRIVNESGSGICVDSGDAAGLAGAIIAMIKMSPAERLAIGKRAKEYNTKHYERNYNLQRLIDFVFNDKRVEDNEYPS